MSRKNDLKRYADLNKKALKSFHSLTRDEREEFNALNLKLIPVFNEQREQTYSEKVDSTTPFGNPFME